MQCPSTGRVRRCEERSDEAIRSASDVALDCFAAAQQQFILSDAAGAVEGLAMTARQPALQYRNIGMPSTRISRAR